MAARLTLVLLVVALTGEALAQNRRQDFQGIIERSPMSGLASQNRYSTNDYGSTSTTPRVVHVAPQYGGSPSCQRTRLDAVQEHYAIKELYRQNKQQPTRLSTGQLTVLASVNAPAKIPVEFGKLNWPRALQRDEFASERALIDQAIYMKDDDGLRDLIEQADAKLRGMVAKLAPDKFVEAVKFLRSLKASV